MTSKVMGVLVVALVVAQPALAASLYVEASANGSRTFQEIYPPNTGKDSISTTSSTTTDTASFLGFAAARYGAGDIGVYVNAQADGTTSGNAGSSASASVGFQDVVSFSDATTVRLNAEVLFDFSALFLSTSPEMGGAGSASGTGAFFSSISWWWGGLGREAAFVICNGGANCERNYTASSPGLYSFEQEILVPAGQTLWINTAMSAYSSTLLYNSVTGQLNGGSARFEISAWNSLRNGITVLTPGVTLNSLSGHDYVFVPHSFPVPEPGTLALLGLGLAGLGLSRRRKAN